MRVLESTPFIHTDGVIHVELDNTKNPVFFIGQHFHDAITAAGGEQKLEPHPAHERLKRGRDSLQSIPVSVMFDDARTNLMARYEAWGDNPSQGPQCIGDGECAKVYNHETQAWVATPCRGPALCPIPSNYNLNCALRSKVLLTVVDDGQELGTFEFRSSAENTFRSMLGNLQALQATHGTLRDLPLNLTGWVKSTQGSSYQPFSCATLERGAGVAQVTAHEVNEGWELLGKHTQDMWMSECIPTDWEMKPLQLPSPKATKPAPRAKAVGDTESLFAHALERMKENHEQRPRSEYDLYIGQSGREVDPGAGKASGGKPAARSLQMGTPVGTSVKLTVTANPALTIAERGWCFNDKAPQQVRTDLA